MYVKFYVGQFDGDGGSYCGFFYIIFVYQYNQVVFIVSDIIDQVRE